MKRNADAAIEASDNAQGVTSKKQKTTEQINEDQEVAAVELVEDELPEKTGKGNKFKELPYVFLSDGSEHLQQCMYVFFPKPLNTPLHVLLFLLVTTFK